MRKLILIQVAIALISVLPAFGQSDTIPNPLEVVDTLNQDFGLFTNDEILHLTLRFNMTQYTRKKPKDEYLDAILTYHINATDSINKNIRLKSRGEMRNGYCSFPPIRLNFKHAGFQKADLSQIEKIKLVTHCQYGNEVYLFKEFLIYKLFNVLTDTSFRVRLVNMEYINTHKKSKPVNTYAFFIEPLEMLAERVNAIEVSSGNLTQKNIIPQMMDRMAIFNYMIGNTDWSVPNQHNCKVLSTLDFNALGLGMVVPYDFDYSGLVDADYAIPYEPLGLSSVLERRYVGICRSEDVFSNALKEFAAKKDAFYKVINDFQLLDVKEKEKMIRYLDSFYEEFDKKNSIVTNILNGCTNF
ncbi:MAG: hypothetical protein U0Z17_10145 [Bacteroidales bacterium]